MPADCGRGRADATQSRPYLRNDDDGSASAEQLVERGGRHTRRDGEHRRLLASTGVYWKPIYNLLEDAFTVLVVNAAHLKTVPGRKTDVRDAEWRDAEWRDAEWRDAEWRDAEWIAELLQHGLLRPSFIPSFIPSAPAARVARVARGARVARVARGARTHPLAHLAAARAGG